MATIRKSFTDEYGVRHFVRGKDEDEINRKIAVLRYKIEKGEQVNTSNAKTRVWAENWLKTYKAGNVGAGWYKDMCAIVENRVLNEIGNVRLKDVKPYQLQNILNNMSGLSASYIKKVKDILNDMFGTALDNGLITKNPARNLTTPPAKAPEERRALTDEEVELLLSALIGHRGNLFCKFMLYCGLRPSEVSALRWVDVDLKCGRVNVNKATKKDGTVGATKSRSGVRVVPIPDVFLNELRSVSYNPFGLVCPQTNGNMQTKSTIRKMWDSVKKQMDILNGAETYRNAIIQTTLKEPLVLYDLRHTYCTHLQEAGVPIDVARRLMGHSSIELTSRIYTHASDNVLDNVTNLINAKNKKAR